MHGQKNIKHKLSSVGLSVWAAERKFYKKKWGAVWKSRRQKADMNQAA